MSSTNFGSILIFSSCLLVLLIYHVGECFHNGRGPILEFKKKMFFSTIMISVGIFTLGGEFRSRSNIVSI